MKPSTGATICVFVKRDLQLVESRLGLFELRAREIELSDRGLMPRVDVIEGLLREQLTLEEAARAVEVVLRELEVGFALTNRRLRDLVGRFSAANLFANLAVFNPGDHLTLAHRIAELDVHDLQASVGARHDFDRGGANQVADHQNLLRDRRALDGGEFHRHRRPARAPAAAPTSSAWRTTPGVVPGAVVDQHAGEADDGDDDDCDCSTHVMPKLLAVSYQLSVVSSLLRADS